jgi:hypothetical protein
MGFGKDIFKSFKAVQDFWFSKNILSNRCFVKRARKRTAPRFLEDKLEPLVSKRIRLPRWNTIQSHNRHNFLKSHATCVFKHFKKSTRTYKVQAQRNFRKHAKDLLVSSLGAYSRNDSWSSLTIVHKPRIRLHTWHNKYSKPSLSISSS